MTVLYLDVDGVLLPFGAPSAPARPAAPGGNPLTSRLDVGPARALGALPVELVWATTWGQDANDLLAPLLGWSALPVLDPAEPSAEDTWFRLHWKTRSILRHAAGRDLVWVDDEITDADEEWLRAHHPGRALLVRVEPHVGLRHDDVETLEAWLWEGSPPAGGQRRGRP
ncbi:HAD domain-containing protein [Cellulomonas sp. SLBN-39]|uniref:HAD domain-containing protein n=1 Tax=Cellulomonas sp. SLBN-39 TaxID=2768446 RepID=UPI00114F5E37|nr:HAD domain-containing protein [Cellulomonas sp. SLBN-39]TQL02959.1 hypothetical protein FBY24_2047 [Cellulomonas sp. SLBN-39]